MCKNFIKIASRFGLNSLGWTCLIVCSSCISTRSNTDHILQEYADQYRKYGDLHSFENSLDRLTGANLERNAVTELLGPGVDLSPQEIENVRKNKKYQDLFPAGIQISDEFRGFVIQEYPLKQIIVLQFRSGLLVHTPGQSYNILTREPTLRINGQPWCLLAFCAPGAFDISPWCMLADTNRTGFVLSSNHAYPFSFSSDEWNALTEIALLPELQASENDDGSPGVDVGSRALTIAVNGIARNVVIYGNHPSEEEQRKRYMTFDRAWNFVKLFKERGERNQKRSLDRAKINP